MNFQWMYHLLGSLRISPDECPSSGEFSKLASALLQYHLSSAALSSSISPPEWLGDERPPGPCLCHTCHYPFISHCPGRLILMT